MKPGNGTEDRTQSRAFTDLGRRRGPSVGNETPCEQRPEVSADTGRRACLEHRAGKLAFACFKVCRGILVLVHL